MTINNNLSVLPFYTNIQEQDWRKSYAYGDVYPLYSQVGYLLPFQIIREHRANNPIEQAYLYKKDGTFVADIKEQMNNAGLTILPYAGLGYDVILYPAIFQLMDMFDGQYYLFMTDGIDEWYSEVFTAVQDMSGFLKLEWYNEANIEFNGGLFIFKNPRFHNFLYFATEVGRPSYTFEEEGESRDGYFFPSKQLSEKRYKFTIVAPEYLCDVMRIIRMCDHVRIRDKYDRIYDCDTFLITPEWQEQGNLAKVDVEFETDTVIKKIGSGFTVPRGGDFNDDYNEDYYR
jgi:hypothetical protein